MSEHREVVIIGSGFGGLFAARALDKAPVDITLIGKTAHHLFQPLLYQVATGILSEGEIAPATREVLRHQKNATTVLGEVVDIDLPRPRHLSIREAPASMAFSTSSLTTLAGRSTTSPAAMRLTVSGERRRMGMRAGR